MSGAPDVHAPAETFDTSTPHSARVWNYWLGGRDNYEADRRLGATMAELYPQIIDIARASRRFQARAVRYLAGEAGIRQFLDLGTGLPTADATHEVAQAAAPTARVVYVDHDPIVLAHARALLTSSPEGATDYVHADLRDTETVLRAAASTLDLDQPVAVMVLSTLGHVADDGEAAALLRGYLDAVPAGSYLMLCDTIETEETAAASDEYADGGAMPYISRPRQTVRSFADGLDLVEPGFGSISLWRPEEPLTGEPVDQWGFVAAKR
ncbi:MULTISPECIES: SAM-dependent methyltransferase [Streptomyces]|uniref:SAM-dependent methyltransferase n=2 Tax=Streptomyces TaxID=1883 RepID=A0A652KPN9_9ACTN|nr:MULTISPECIES: SAM-dependent methyltransferase [unclassified Streptomyces]WSS60519.1 SAM-dependent methyltransferase [Streptomyces sp. NBC_01177]WSS67566.1 SAM-dependent methyltransferase [Streptomyces sp. NBC_01175]WSS74557.1 SAM-dependent methyltransferase [Streptomyces sp. NBC_01174]MDX3326594.1 SAM-dependent methyltransferase [Streptomyces sp. ME02-6979-3A]MDX3432384.1 SAM-dependent methyltransferase [Streptomyces sp. ME01-18a]